MFSHVWLFVTLWTIASQSPLSMGFPRQEYWGGLPFKIWNYSSIESNLFFNQKGSRTTKQNNSETIPGKYRFTRSFIWLEVNYSKADQTCFAESPGHLFLCGAGAPRGTHWSHVEGSSPQLDIAHPSVTLIMHVQDKGIICKETQQYGHSNK